MSQFRELAERLTVGCRILAEQDIVDAYGHLSARLPGGDGLFVINRGMSPALVEPEDFVVMDFSGKVVDGNGYPNSEWPIHACAFKARPDVGCVLHSHQRLSRIFSLSHHKLRGVLTSAVAEWRDGLPIYRGAGLVNTPERGDALAAILGSGSAALLRGHGDIVVGPSITSAVIKALTLKANADILHELMSHGGEIEPWSEDDVTTWGGPMHDHLAPEAAEALASKAWDYYEARVSGRLARLLHPELGS